MDAETEVEATRVGRGVGVGGPRQIKVQAFGQPIDSIQKTFPSLPRVWSSELHIGHLRYRFIHDFLLTLPAAAIWLKNRF